MADEQESVSLSIKTTAELAALQSYQRELSKATTAQKEFNKAVGDSKASLATDPVKFFAGEVEKLNKKTYDLTSEKKRLNEAMKAAGKEMKENAARAAQELKTKIDENKDSIRTMNDVLRESHRIIPGVRDVIRGLANPIVALTFVVVGLIEKYKEFVEQQKKVREAVEAMAYVSEPLTAFEVSAASALGKAEDFAHGMEKIAEGGSKAANELHRVTEEQRLLAKLQDERESKAKALEKSQVRLAVEEGKITPLQGEKSLAEIDLKYEAIARANKVRRMDEEIKNQQAQLTGTQLEKDNAKKRFDRALAESQKADEQKKNQDTIFESEKKELEAQLKQAKAVQAHAQEQRYSIAPTIRATRDGEEYDLHLAAGLDPERRRQLMDAEEDRTATEVKRIQQVIAGHEGAAVQRANQYKTVARELEEAKAQADTLQKQEQDYLKALEALIKTRDTTRKAESQMFQIEQKTTSNIEEAERLKTKKKAEEELKRVKHEMLQRTEHFEPTTDLEQKALDLQKTIDESSRGVNSTGEKTVTAIEALGESMIGALAAINVKANQINAGLIAVQGQILRGRVDEQGGA